MARVELNIDLNWVEGDLEIGLTLEDGVVVEARTVGTLYRGFEQILVGRAPRDAMVITPRVCGICGTAHLYAAVLALEHAWQLPVPANATRIRNLCLMAEGIQNDLRQTFLFFAPDFCNPRYRQHPLFDELMAAFEPFKGALHRETLAMTRRVLEIVAHFGGQWPHSSYMLPGGVVTPPDERRVLACLAALDEVQRWYEQRILGAPHFLAPPPGSERDGQGYGMVMAARGALGHWVKIKDGRVEKYQIVTPTAWNASPRDSAGEPGHWERSLVGVRVQDPDDPVEIGHLIRSHDPCLVCTVHMLGSGRKLRFMP